MYKLLAILINISLFASTIDFYEKSLIEIKPNTIFENVDVTTGKYIYEENIIVDGIEKIDLCLDYFSLENNDSRSRDDKFHNQYILSGWSYLDLYKAFYYGNRIDVIDEGTVYSFDFPKIELTKKVLESKKDRKKREKKQKEFDNQTYDLLLLEIKHLKNSKNTKKFLKATLNGINDLEITFLDGKILNYKKEKQSGHTYLLNKIILPNKNKILYCVSKS